MKIIPYEDLKDKTCLLPLMDSAFEWVFTPSMFEELIEVDPRLEGTPIGFCACEDDLVVGFVGVMHLRSRTIEGDRSEVGGVYRVATLPGYTKRGIGTKLLICAHEYFQSMDYGFSFLTTQRSLVAYSLYRKLGYRELLESRSAYKLMTRTSGPDIRAVSLSEVNIRNLLRIYNGYMENRCGFVIRDKLNMWMLEKSEGTDSLYCVLADQGYLIYRYEKKPKQPASTHVKELVALDSDTMYRLVRLAESLSDNVVYDRTVIDDSLFQVYKSQGYLVQSKGNTVIMVKALERGVSAKELYGDRFFALEMDFPMK